jgi:ATP-dependent protease Clp ATPase subunit
MTANPSKTPFAETLLRIVAPFISAADGTHLLDTESFAGDDVREVLQELDDEALQDLLNEIFT